MQSTCIAAEQPDLVADIPPGRRHAAVEATRAATLVVGLGPWVAEDLHGPPGHLGVLLLDGLLSREVHVGHRSCLELLGVGDVLRPWDALGDASSIAIDARWTVQNELRLGVLDRAFALQIARFPEISAALMRRLVRRSRWLAFHLAVCHLPQLEVRLRVVFWYMADRWGRVTPDGVVVPLTLTHDLLGELVGAHRSPVTRALGRLAEAGQVTRRRDGTWLLTGHPPGELMQIHRRASGARRPAEPATVLR